MVNITNITPSFLGLAQAVASATNGYFFPTSIVVLGIIFVMRYLDSGFPIDWVMVVALFVTSVLSTIISLTDIALVPLWFAQLNIVFFSIFVIWAALTKTR